MLINMVIHPVWYKLYGYIIKLDFIVYYFIVALSDLLYFNVIIKIQYNTFNAYRRLGGGREHLIFNC